jgi:uncharacterized iron-regulated membrane protein
MRKVFFKLHMFGAAGQSEDGDERSSRTTAAGTRLANLNRAIHTGDIVGMPTKILMSLASFAAVAQVITGLMMGGTRRDAARR